MRVTPPSNQGTSSALHTCNSTDQPPPPLPKLNPRELRTRENDVTNMPLTKTLVKAFARLSAMPQHAPLASTKPLLEEARHSLKHHLSIPNKHLRPLGPATIAAPYQKGAPPTHHITRHMCTTRPDPTISRPHGSDLPPTTLASHDHHRPRPLLAALIRAHILVGLRHLRRNPAPAAVHPHTPTRSLDVQPPDPPGTTPDLVAPATAAVQSSPSTWRPRPHLATGEKGRGLAATFIAGSASFRQPARAAVRQEKGVQRVWRLGFGSCSYTTDRSCRHATNSTRVELPRNVGPTRLRHCPWPLAPLPPVYCRCSPRAMALHAPATPCAAAIYHVLPCCLRDMVVAAPVVLPIPISTAERHIGRLRLLAIFELD
nr:unnamed protein product [Digitaria exilis]